MLGETIKACRQAKGFSQEELAAQLNVVRQTVSKWERDLSVPDAELLRQLAEVLEVPVSRLLDLPEPQEAEELSAQLAALREQLAEKERREQFLARANRVRGLILSLSFLAMLLALLIKNEWVSALLAGACMLAAVAVLYRNLLLLTSVTNETAGLGPLKVTTIFSGGILLAAMTFAVLTGLDVLRFSEYEDRMFAMALIVCVMVFAGIVSPKLPYNRHTGLRLPWTVQDEETWNVAHRALGIISLPTALLYVAVSLTISDFEAVTLCAVLLWVGIPALLSLAFFWRKIRPHS